MDVKMVHDEPDNKPEDVYEVEEVLNDLTTDMNYRHKYTWGQVTVHAAIQTAGLIGLYSMIFYAKWATIVWTLFLIPLIGQSLILGAHRCFSHKSFKVTTPLKFSFLFFQTMAGQNSMFTWVRDHKLHHKYSDTDADPHNSKRGFFFSHMGWLLVDKHPLVTEKQKQIDVSELLTDKMVMFQYKYFLQLYFVTGVLFPVAVPMYLWNETLWSSFFVAYAFQYAATLHGTWCINSFAHLWGPRSYDKRIRATQSKIAGIVTGGDGWHNFHHAFPWDCRLSEYGQKGGLGTRLLDMYAYLGLAYDLKTVSPQIVSGHMKRHGDGTQSIKKLNQYENYKTEEIMKEIPKKLQ